MYSANPRRFPDEQIYDYCAASCRSLGLCFQRSSGRSCEWRGINWEWFFYPYSQKRHQSDSELNARKAKVLTSQSTFAEKKWKDIQVGDVVRLESDDFIPADMVLISSSEPEGLCYIETSNLDGWAIDPYGIMCFQLMSRLQRNQPQD